MRQHADDLFGQARAGDPIALVRALVQTPSVNPALEVGGVGEAAIARLSASWLEEWGFETRLDRVGPDRFNVLARLGSGTPVTLLNGHLDTVGVEGMTVPAFGAELDGAHITGRGSCDMKGGVAALLAAACRFAQKGGPGTLWVILTADEEHASLGMQSVIATGITADRAIVCEPTELAIMPAHKGFLWVEVHFVGRAAHGSRPEVGVDAVRHAGLYLAELETMHAGLAKEPAHPLLGHASFHAGTIQGGNAPSVYPARCKLVLERRTLPDERLEDVFGDFGNALDALRRAHPQVDARLDAGLYRPGTEVATEHALVADLKSAIEADGGPARIEGMTAWVDAAFLNEAGIPAVCYGPGSIAQAHSADEWIEADQIRQAADVLERFLCAP